MIQYKFSNLLGTVYSGGNLLFTEQPSTTDPSLRETLLLSPVGNKLTVFDLTNNLTSTMACQNRSNIERVELAPDGKTLITIDGEGFALLINFPKRVVIAHLNFKDRVTAFAFSPDSRFFLVATGKKVKIFETPSVTHKVYSPLVLYKKYGNLHSDVITGATWTSDSRFFVTWSKDLTMKMMSLHKLENYLPFTFGGHKKKLIKVFFSQDDTRIFTLSQNGTILLWKWVDERSEGVQRQLEFQGHKMGKRLKVGDKPNEYVPVEADKELYTDLEKRVTTGRYVLEKKTKIALAQGVKVESCEVNGKGAQPILVIGQTNGVFGLFNLDTLESMHTFQITENRINSVSVTASGEWIALGSKDLGQLLVWEWRSESYILKQQGHFFDLNTLAYSPDGSILATGGDDGKLKLWTTKNHLCFSTFTEHTGTITALQFVPKKNNTLVSAGLDGTVRAYDLVKYRCFRTMTANKPVQFTCLAIEQSGDLIVCGSNEPFNLYIWSLQTGALLEILTGHTAPISSLAFSPSGTTLASGAWDNTVKIWDLFDKKGIMDTLQHGSEVLAVDYHPNGREVVSTTLSGQVYTWSAEDSSLMGIIDAKSDLAGGRLRDERVSAKNSTRNKYLTTVAVSPTGDFFLGGGNSKNLCLYDLRYKLLMKRFALTQNRSLDGVLQILNSKDIKDGMAQHEMDIDEDLEEDAWQVRNAADQTLPGAKRPNNATLVKRSTKLAIRVKCVKFSPDGSQFACATTEGVIIYSIKPDLQTIFNPLEIDSATTLDAIIQLVKDERYLDALVYSLRLNNPEVLEKVFNSTPNSSIALISAHFPSNYLGSFIDFLILKVEQGKDFEWTMLWIKNILQFQGEGIRQLGGKGQNRTRLLRLYSAVNFYEQSLKKIANENIHMMKFMLRAYEHRKEESTME